MSCYRDRYQDLDLELETIVREVERRLKYFGEETCKKAHDINRIDGEGVTEVANRMFVDSVLDVDHMIDAWAMSLKLKEWGLM